MKYNLLKQKKKTFELSFMTSGRLKPPVGHLVHFFLFYFRCQTGKIYVPKNCVNRNFENL